MVLEKYTELFHIESEIPIRYQNTDVNPVKNNAIGTFGLWLNPTGTEQNTYLFPLQHILLFVQKKKLFCTQFLSRDKYPEVFI